MRPEELQAYIALLAAAYQLGTTIYAGVREVVSKQLTPEQNAEVLATWQDNVTRSAKNAGLV